MFQLVITDPQGNRQQLQLDLPEYIIGRDPQVAIPLNGPKISRRHARIFRKAGRYWIEDLGSANGVVSGGRPITTARRLTPGVTLEVGGYFMGILADNDSACLFSLVGTMQPFLDQHFRLSPGQINVGRTDGNAIVIADASISRRHAILDVGVDEVIIEDLDSSNGTWVNAVRIGRRQLQPGDRVRFGNIEFLFGRAEQSMSVSTIARTWNQFRQFERPIQLAIGVGIISLLAVISMLTVAIYRKSIAPDTTAVGKLLQKAYDQAVEKGLTQARKGMAGELWQDAERAFKSVLDRDPINAEARRGIVTARENQEDKNNLTAAREALTRKQPAEALVRLRRIDQTGFYANAAQELILTARNIISDAELELARRTCKNGEWKECHKHAVICLENQPDSASGHALISEAETAMRNHRIYFSAWVPSRTSGVTSQTALNTLYRDSETRLAVLRYAVGDLDTAIQRLHNRDQGQAASVEQWIAEVRRQKNAGDSAANTGDMDRAIKAWEDALTADAQIIPSYHPSVLRETVKQRLNDELFRKGDNAFSSGNFTAAWQLWSAALKYKPSDPDVLGGIASLEVRAKAILDDVGTHNPLSTEACHHLHDITGMTQPGSAIYQAALERLQTACRK